VTVSSFRNILIYLRTYLLTYCRAAFNEIGEEEWVMRGKSWCHEASSRPAWPVVQTQPFVYGQRLAATTSVIQFRYSGAERHADLRITRQRPTWVNGRQGFVVAVWRYGCWH